LDPIWFARSAGGLCAKRVHLVERPYRL